MGRVDLEICDKELSFLRKKVRMSAVQPTNFSKEKKKIRKDRTYEPQFKYKKYPHDLQAIKKRLLTLRTDKSIFGKLLDERRKEFIHMTNTLMSLGTPNFTTHSIRLYGKPSIELVNKSRKLLQLEENEKYEQYNTFTTTKKFLDALLCKGLNWTVKRRDMVVNASFNISDRIIYINKNRKFSDLDLKRLLVHEIGTHVMRAEHAQHHKHRIFYYGFPNYLETEEGLAVYNEDTSGLLTTNLLRTYAGRVLAVHLALHNSFSTVYNSLLEFFNKEDAWTLTVRAKRGLGNTGRPGGYTKDYLYLNGYFRVKHYVKKGGNINKLYTGKIGVEHVNLLPHLRT